MSLKNRRKQIKAVVSTPDFLSGGNKGGPADYFRHEENHRHSPFYNGKDIEDPADIKDPNAFIVWGMFIMGLVLGGAIGALIGHFWIR